MIDWSEPCIASVCVDLYKFVINTPEEIGLDLIDYYRKSIDFPEFDTVWAAVQQFQSLTMLGQLGYIVQGESHKSIAEVSTKQMEDFMKFIIS